MKTNKSVKKRIALKGSGVRVRKSGHGHFNAKMSRRKQLARNRGRPLSVSKKEMQRFFVNL
ncbi:MAG: hypothetical protein OXU73_02580 [Candidatus Campbellbacteria bacterium]|nr:hypothetical protein [Candidatus Campbellbacteria bacterium]